MSTTSAELKITIDPDGLMWLRVWRDGRPYATYRGTRKPQELKAFMGLAMSEILDLPALESEVSEQAVRAPAEIKPGERL